MKPMYLVAITLLAFSGIAWTTSSFIPQEPGDPCGVVTLGKYKVDLTSGEMSAAIPKDALIENFKSGLVFVGSSQCAGTYEIIDMHLTIDGARDAMYEYDHDFVLQMQAMEPYMLTRYFNDALNLNFNNIKAKNSAGNIIEIPSVSFVVN